MTLASAPVEILTVDADAALLANLQRALPSHVARIRAVSGMAAVREACQRLLPDLLIVDLGSQPAPAGLALCSDLHAAPTTAAIPLLCCGDFADEALAGQALASGAADLFTPPYTTGLLRARLQSHLIAVHDRAALNRERHARAAAERAVDAVHRSRDDLLANMGHEIRTPMTAILGMSHLALQSGLNQKQRNYVEKVERSAELLLGTLNDILDSARIEAGTLELEQSPFDLGELLDGVGRMVGLRAEERGLELLFDVPQDLPTTLIGDGGRLRQVLVNLGLDAVRAARHGEILLRIRRDLHASEPARLHFSIVRSGPGPALTPTGATSLGTSLSRQLLRLMGSSLSDAGAVAPTVGAEFAVEFAIDRRVAQPSGAVGLTALPAGMRTLIVDDSDTARSILLAMCDELGLQADAARDGWDGLRMASQAQRLGTPYRLVLLDAKMPGMDGAECARHLAMAHPEPPTIVLLTASGPYDVAPRTGTVGSAAPAIHGWTPKPVTPSALGAAIRAALQQKGAVVAHGLEPGPALRDPAARLRGARILLVEDNAIIQELALELLSAAGMLVSLAENGREALDRLAKQTFDGVLMDCQMPVLDGYEATRALRAIPSLKSLPVIALTANAIEGERGRVLAAGMNDLIFKPLDVGAMFETLARWVQPVRPVEAPVIVPPVQAPDDPLTRLPGITARIGRSSTMNNDKLYRRLLGMFRDGQRDVVGQFRAARTAGDHATAMRLAHNLRAVSASLGAQAVQQSAGALERACADHSPDTVVEPLLRQVETDLTPVMTGLAQLLPT